jgi:hypothetical protein
MPFGAGRDGTSSLIKEASMIRPPAASVTFLETPITTQEKKSWN